MTAFNYPNHPLFRIVPLLYNWRGDVRHDEYVSHLVGRIRAGRYTPELWDCNGFYLDYSERLANPADRQLTAFKSRHKLTPAQLEEYRKEVRAEWQAGAAERAERAQKRAASEAERRAEWERVEREWVERLARQEAEKERREREWAEREAEIAAERERQDTERAENQRKAILANKWQCQKCKAIGVKVEEQRKGYLLTCRGCGANAWGAHKTLVRMLPLKALVA